MTRDAARHGGVLAEWNDGRGFGFITPSGGGPRTFVHISAFPRGVRPRTGVRVTYAESRDERNRPRASAVEYVGRTPVARRPGLISALLVAGGFLLGVLALTVFGDAPIWLPAAYVGLSLASVVLYRSDKAAAQSGGWRVSEATFHLLALVGGWPGALVARHLLRHKTMKQPFVTVFWLTVGVNCLALLWVSAGMPTAIV